MAINRLMINYYNPYSKPVPAAVCHCFNWLVCDQITILVTKMQMNGLNIAQIVLGMILKVSRHSVMHTYVRENYKVENLLIKVQIPK